MVRRTLISLTIQYSFLLLGLFALFGSALYIDTVHTFDTDYRQAATGSNIKRPSNADIGTADAIDAGVARLRKSLIISYAGLLVVTPLISYGLARRSLQPVVRNYNAQQHFVDSASHELRTPLGRIQGELELALSAKRSGDDYRKAIGASLKEIEGLGNMMSTLLLLARGTAQQFDDSRQEVRLQTSVSKALEAIHATYGNSTPAIINRMRRKAIMIVVMPELFEHALINILDNAVKFTPVTGKIIIEAEVDSSRVMVRITDNGRGMDSDEIEHAFDRFWRAKDSQSVTGHGLGLPFAKQVIEAHDGKIAIRTGPEQGIATEITLPLRSMA